MKIWLGSDECVYLSRLLFVLSEQSGQSVTRKHLARLSDKVKPDGRYVHLKQSEITFMKALMHDAQKTLKKIGTEEAATAEMREAAESKRTAISRIVARLERPNA